MHHVPYELGVRNDLAQVRLLHSSQPEPHLPHTAEACGDAGLPPVPADEQEAVCWAAVDQPRQVGQDGLQGAARPAFAECCSCIVGCNLSGRS